MTTSEILNIVLPVVLSSIVIPLLVAAGNAFKKYYGEKVKNEKLQRYFDMANDAIITAVAEVMQTFVTTMKQTGQWNAEAAKQAFEMAKLRAQEIMGVAALQALPEIVDDVETWLTSKIEAATLKMKETSHVHPSVHTSTEGGVVFNE